MKSRIFIKNKSSILIAVLAAALYGISAPASKVLLNYIDPLFLASLLYLGAGLGMVTYSSLRKIKTKQKTEASLSKNELPYVIAMILLDIIAPILLLLGLQKTSAGTASLLNNFEIVATSIIALVFFKEAIGKRQWIAMALIIIASAILTFSAGSGFKLSFGAVYILLACLSWGAENNCTRQLSLKDPVQIVDDKRFRLRNRCAYSLHVVGRAHPECVLYNLRFASGFCFIRAEHIAICFCPTQSGSGSDEHILFNCAVYRSDIVMDSAKGRYIS